MAGAIIDLSGPLGPDAPVFPGDPHPQFATLQDVKNGGCHLSSFSLGAHNGAHVDAPLHAIEGGLPVDRLDLSRLWGTARLLSIAGPPSGRPIAIVEALEAGLAPGRIAVVRTGWAAPGDSAAPWIWPWPSEGLLDWLVGRKIAAYMTDAPSVDPPGSLDLPAHRRLLSEGIPIVECLASLSLLPEGKDFTICALPLRLSGLEASPCRAAAWLEG